MNAGLGGRFHATTGPPPLTEVWLDRLDLVPGVTILDVASGHGIPPFHLAELVGPTGTVLGMDWSERQVASACVSRRPS